LRGKILQKKAVFRLVAVALVALSAQPLFGRGALNGNFTKSGVVLDGSFGPSGPLPGPNYMIPASFGKQVGSNLFHSFSQFNLTTSGAISESATFTGPSNIQNILARVTSGSPSSIDGKVSSQIQGANLFFLNPSGVIFGPHAQLDVSGSVAVTTANYVKLVGGGRFNANLGGGDVLTSAPVSAFGFFNPAPAGVSIMGSNTGSNGVINPGPGLDIAPEKSFSIVAGNISINAGNISGAGSRVNLVSVKSAGEAQLDATSLDSALDVSQFLTLGNVTLTLSRLNVDGPSGGPVQIRGRDVRLDQSSISSVTTGSSDGRSVDISATGTVDLQGAQILSFISTASTGTGNGGNISVSAEALNLNLGFIISPAVSFGDGGKVTLRATSINMSNGAIDTVSDAQGRAGDVTLIADEIIMRGASIFSQSAGLNLSNPGGGGNITLRGTNAILIEGDSQVSTNTGTAAKAGNIVVQGGDLELIDGGEIAAATGGNGDGGAISINVDSLTIAGVGTLSQSKISSDTGFIGPRQTGNAGQIAIVAREVQITNGGQISSSTFREGNGGNVNVKADSLLVDGTGSGIFATAEPGSSGDAGSIVVQAHNLMKINFGGEISSSTFSSGDGGNVKVTGGSLSINGAGSSFLTGISADADHGTGNAGSVTVRADNLTLVNGGAISTDTFDMGNGGDVTITANSLLINGAGAALPTGISADADRDSSGNAGRVVVDAGKLRINNGGKISSRTFAAGNGGDVKVTANSLLINGAGAPLATGILADTLGSGRAGSVIVQARGLTITDHGAIAASADRSSGESGDVAVSAEDLVLQDGGVIAAASFTTATAGSLRLTLGTLSMDSDSSISSANFGSGDAGSVLVKTTDDVKLRHASSISTESALRNAGSIHIISGGEIKLSSGSKITASAGTNGGNIHISAPILVSLIDSNIVAIARNIGGSITIDPLALQLNSSTISASAGVQGGHIDLFTSFLVGPVEAVKSDGTLLLADHSSISATGGTANGTVNVTAPNLDLGAELITLPESLVSAANQLQERCTALLQGDFSSFISIGRGGMEEEPEELETEF
jgi:filamentous hemagglutinin family protein